MGDSSRQARPRRLWRGLYVLVLLALFILVIGFALDLSSGFAVIRGARSVAIGILGVFGLGVLYLLGEAGVQWIRKRDRRMQAIPERIFRNVALVAFLIMVGVGMYILFRVAM